MNESLATDTLLVGRYHILERIGEGGFGTVYKARDQRKWGKLVAIKEINMAALSAQEKIEVTDSYNREIMLLSKLKHKSLPRIYDQFTDPEHWYIVMDYIEGQTLEDLFARSPKGKLTVKQTARIGIALCDVLSYLHNQQPSIIFRDVKPGNIMLTFWDRLYLIDFGIARRYRSGQARDTGPLGSPGYAAPEQYGRMQTTERTDIYGLGITLQTLLTGKEPLEILQQGMPPDVCIPQKLQTLISQMIDPDPNKRPYSMNDVKRALSHYESASSYQEWATTGLFSTLMFQSRFTESVYLIPYLLFAVTFIVCFCTITFLRARRNIPPVKLSLKATTLIVRKQLLFSLWIVLRLSGCVSLLYAILARPALAGSQLFFLWFYGGAFVLASLIRFILWLKERREMQEPNRPPTLPQEMPMQQHR
jgi:serine/threonine protein kinase